MYVLSNYYNSMHSPLSIGILVFLLVNAVYWGLFPHATHCKLITSLGVSNCPPHWVHLIIGLFSYLTAMWLEQSSYIKTLMPN